MSGIIRIGTRESQLAIWQASQVKDLLGQIGHLSELVYIKSDGDINLKTPLYEMGVQGIFTRSLDAALLEGQIDIAVHSMKDVPTRLPDGIIQAAVLKRASYKDLLVYKGDSLNKLGYSNGSWPEINAASPFTIATSSIRRKAQWLHRYPDHQVENLRGNVNTRLQKLKESDWDGAIFAAAGLERINLRPDNAIDLDWMLPAPAQGAIMVVCREDDKTSIEACKQFNDKETAICTKAERDFLRALMGGCSTPISGLATIKKGIIEFKGNILSPDGKEKAEVSLDVSIEKAGSLGMDAANLLLNSGGREIAGKLKFDE